MEYSITLLEINLKHHQDRIKQMSGSKLLIEEINRHTEIAKDLISAINKLKQ